jgi:hypothetical protein
MRTLKLAVLTIAALLLPALSLGQTVLTQTTISANIGHGTTSFQLASVTGITGTGAINNAVGGTVGGNANTTDLYIDRELMQVVTVNTTGKTVTVLRGQGGSQASAHASGAMVLAGPPGAFFNYDPEGYCGTATNIGAGSQSQPPQYTPWINQRTGAQWLCSSITNTWVPGFTTAQGSSSATLTQTATVAAAAGVLLPSGPLFVISGSGAITGFTIPVGCNATAVGGCTITVIAAAGSTWTWTAAGNIMTAGTGTAGHTFTFTWSASLSKFVPSALT